MTADSCKPIDFGVFLAIWNDSQKYTTPSIHFRMATWLQKFWTSGNKRLLLMAFRASGKSTLVGLFSAWLLYRDPDSRILVLSAESNLSSKMVRTIRKVIETHPFTSHLRPKNPDQWASDSFTVQRKRVSRDPSVLARGLFSNITGTRADVIICDDVEVPNTCDTADKRVRLRERLSENEFILTPGGVQLYIGTPHSYYSLYTQNPRTEIGEERAYLQDYRRLKLPIIDKAGKSAWPERYTLEDIEFLKRQTGPARFASQMMLAPVNIADSRLDPALLRPYKAELESSEAQRALILKLEDRKLVSASAWWDPAFGKSTGDSSVLAIVYTDEEGDVWLHRTIYLKLDGTGDVDEATAQCRLVCEIVKSYFLPSIAIETNGIGKFLPAILRKELAAARIPCAVLEKTSTQNKDLRILEAFDAVMAARALHVHASVYQTPFIREMQEWAPGKSRILHDDGLDAAAGALGLQPVRLRRTYFSGRAGWHNAAMPHQAQSEFDV